MPKKGENIYKRKDGRWEGRYIKSRICSGKIVYGYVYAKTYREVKAKLRETTASWNQQTTAAVTTSEFIFSKIASDWFEYAYMRQPLHIYDITLPQQLFQILLSFQQNYMVHIHHMQMVC